MTAAPAVPHPIPAAPNRLRLFAVDLLLALGLAAALVLVAEQLDTSFHSLDELRSFTNLPVLANIPRIMTSADIRHRRRRLELTAAATVCVIALLIGASYFVVNGNEQLLRLLTTSGRS